MTNDFSLQTIFQDHMMFQANKPVKIFGSCQKNIEITIELLGKIARFFTTEETFCFTLDSIPVIATPFSWTISSNNQSLTITDCLAGDVILCTGQSNMQFTCKEAVDIDYEEISTLRFYEVPKLPYVDAEKEFEWLYQNNPFWRSCTKETAPWFSAIGYLVGRDLTKAEGIPIGIISCNMGDTSIFSWIDEEELGTNPSIKRILDQYQEQYGQFLNYEEYNATFLKQLPILMEFYGEIERGVAKGFSSEKAHEEAFRKYPNPYLPMGPKNQNRPHGMYDMMIQPIIPFQHQAILYYQGENDKINHDIYLDGLRSLVRSWRKNFQSDTPFILSQIAGYEAMDLTNFESGRLREAQANFNNPENQCYVVSAADLGEPYNIHPKDKNGIAKRFFQVLEEVVYHHLEHTISPIIDSYAWQGEDLILYTKYNELDLKQTSLKSGITGIYPDKVVKNLEISLDKKNIIIRNAKGVKELRYAYDHFPVHTIYTKNDLPLLGFDLNLE